MVLELFVAMQVAGSSIPDEGKTRDPAELECLSGENVASTRKLAASEAFKQLGGGQSNVFSEAAFKQMAKQLDYCSEKFTWSAPVKAAANIYLLGDLSLLNMRTTYAVHGISFAKIESYQNSNRRSSNDENAAQLEQKALANDLITQGLKRSEQEATDVVYVYLQLLDIAALSKNAFSSGKGM